MIPRSCRSTALLVLMLGLLASAPAQALANPLLSGYGGPGQGEQAILGGGMVNGPSGGSSGGGSTAISTAPSEASSAGSTTTSGHATPTRQRRAHSRTRSQKHAAVAPTSTTPAHRSAGGPVASGSNASSSQLLGLSGEDIIYVALAVCLLIATAAAIKRLAGGPRPPAKGTGRITRVHK